MKSTANLSDARSTTTCVSCSSVVELSVSLLMKRGRVVGCPSCDWGAARVRVTPATQTAERDFPLRATA